MPILEASGIEADDLLSTGTEYKSVAFSTMLDDFSFFILILIHDLCVVTAHILFIPFPS